MQCALNKSHMSFYACVINRQDEVLNASHIFVSFSDDYLLYNPGNRRRRYIIPILSCSYHYIIQFQKTVVFLVQHQIPTSNEFVLIVKQFIIDKIFMAFIVATTEKLDQTVYSTRLCYTDEEIVLGGGLMSVKLIKILNV